MTEQEAQALAQILQRTPMTTAEALWVNALLARLVLPKGATAPPSGDLVMHDGRSE